MSIGTGGFEGAVGGMPLSDVIQLKAYNRYTGTISIEFSDNYGIIYFRNGEIVHAEASDKMGEEAFYQMIRWPGGRFSMENNVAAPARTIENSVSYLLLEAHRLMDEDNNPDAAAEYQASSKVEKSKPLSVIERISSINGVVSAALINDRNEMLEGKGSALDELKSSASYLAKSASRIGEMFGTGSFLSSALQCSGRQMLLFESKKHILAVNVSEESTIVQIEAAVRSAMTPKK